MEFLLHANETVQQVGDLARALLPLIALVLAILATIKATKWGKNAVVTEAEEVLQLLQRIAEVAVGATQQMSKTQQMTNEQMKQEAWNRAMQMIPAGFTVDGIQLDAAIEQAVQKLKAGVTSPLGLRPSPGETITPIVSGQVSLK